MYEKILYIKLYSKCKNRTLEEQAIINILKNNPTITQEKITKEINKSLRTVKSHMSDMKEKMENEMDSCL